MSFPTYVTVPSDRTITFLARLYSSGSADIL